MTSIRRGAMRHMFVRWGLCVALAVTTFTGVATVPASAASPLIASGASLRYCIKTNLSGCQTSSTWTKGAVTMVCWRDGSSATGAYTSKRWFYLTQGTRRGWAHSSRVTSQVSVPNCSTHRGVSAATRAAETNGQVAADRPVADWLWGQGSDARWSGGCAGLVSASFYFGAKVTPRYRGDAAVMYRSYKAAGRMRSMSTTPSVGAPVFWPNSSKWGHTATYVGNGLVMTTVGYPGQSYPNKRTSMSSLGTPSGWVHPNDM